MNKLVRDRLLTCSVWLLLPASVLAQGSLTPPGAPAALFKTLHQVEPRIDLKTLYDANHDGILDDSSTEIRIDAPGSYYLSENLIAVRSTGIRIATGPVTIDMNGFEIRRQGSSSLSTGITIDATLTHCTIRNGSVAGFGVGFDNIGGASAPRAVLFVDLVALNCSTGFRTGTDWVLERCRSIGGNTGFDITRSSLINCTASRSVGVGFQVRVGSVLRGCIADDNGTIGYRIDGSAVFSDCIARDNIEAGFKTVASVLPLDTTLTNCAAVSNPGGGFVLTETSTLTNCTARANGGSYGIFVGPGSTLTGCTASDNTSAYGIFAGAGSTISHCTGSGNQGQYGIFAENRSSIIGCTAAGNTSAAAESFAIKTGDQCTIVDSNASGTLNTSATATNLTGGGINAGRSSVVRNSIVTGNRGDGILIEGDSNVVGNNVDSNGFNGEGAGIHSTGADNRIEGNNVADCDRGIEVDSAGSLIVKNSVSGSAGGAVNNYVIAAGNADAAIEVPGAAFTSTNSWANFSY